jgi:hypothetical protein
MHLIDRRIKRLVTAFSSKQKRWFDLECINIYGRKRYRMVNSKKEKNPPHNVILPSQLGRLLIEYQEHPEAKSLAPDGSQCKSDTTGLLGRAHIVAGELRYTLLTLVCGSKHLVKLPTAA